MHSNDGDPIASGHSDRSPHAADLPAGRIGASALVAQAAALWQQGRHSDAEALAQYTLSYAPQEHSALHLLGLIARQNGDMARAIEFLRQAIAIDDQIAAYHGNLGNAYFEAGQLGEAAGCFRQVLTLEPGAAQAHFGLGLALMGQKVYDAAADELEQATKARPDHASAHLNLGIALTELGRWNQAIANCRRAVALDPGYAANHFSLGVALRANGDLLAAHEHFAHAIELDPKFAKAHYQLGTTLDALGRTEEATKVLQRAAKLFPDMAEARVELQKLVRHSPQSPEAAATTSGTSANILKPSDEIGSSPPDCLAAADRLGRYIELFSDLQQHPRMGFYPGLTARPWHDTTGFPIVNALEQAFADIRREITTLESTPFQDEIEEMPRVGSWEVFLFYERGKKNSENCSRCPVITEIIESHNTVRTLAGLMYASRTKPGTHIVPHQGPTNMRLRVHLGISIPQGDCGLRVGNEIRRWKEGKCLVFDDHFEHESWNYTKEPRVVLILDIWHPDLTSGEIAFLEGLHRYAYYQAGSLNRYWAANAEARERARKEYD